MYPHDFKSFIDHVYEAYFNLHDEVLRLRRENKILNEEHGKLKAMNSSLAQKLNNSVINPVKLLKMGSDWFFDGDDVFTSLCLTQKLKFQCPISKSRISKSGLIGFSCNSCVFVGINDTFYLVGDTIQQKDPRDFITNLRDISLNHFCFVNDDLVVKTPSSIVCYRGLKKLWCIPVERLGGMEIHNLCSDSASVYVGFSNRISIISYEDSNTTISSKEISEGHIGLRACNGEVVLFTENSISFLSGGTKKETFDIYSLEYNGNSVYYGGSSSTLKIAKWNKGTRALECFETLIFKKPILAIKTFRNLIFVSIEDKVVNVVDTRNKMSMRMVFPDNIIEINSNENQVVFLDNNGGIRVWEPIEGIRG